MPSIISKMLRPLGFTPGPVTIIATLLYAAVLASVLFVHLVVPPAPRNPTPVKGINISEAWLDLQEITNGYHPYNSRRNDEVRNWLLKRIDDLVHHSGDGSSSLPGSEDIVVTTGKVLQERNTDSGLNSVHSEPLPIKGERDHVVPVVKAVIFNDIVSNVTFSSSNDLSSSGRKGAPGASVYFEGTNIMVYIPGSDDDAKWQEPETVDSMDHGEGVLVNVHYDSVSTGFGATDDGVGVVTALQLIKFYTTEENKPRKGLLVLFNNGEEDYLNGARAFIQHPISQFPRTFLNLEGAGAGGRATLFRSTDVDVTKFYGRSRNPFGNVISADGFKRGLVRSQTDYIIFKGELGLRGLDVAFMEPRARYHTDQDDTRHTSKDSLWHMLSAALTTTQGLTSDGIDSSHKEASDGVWFDIYGLAFATFPLRTLFGLSVALLVAAPIILMAFALALSMTEKMYFFSAKTQYPDLGREKVPLQGWRGFTRLPFTLIASSAAVLALALLITKINPFIVYSSPYAVWATMLSAWIFVSWFCLSLGDYVRPSALYRGYAHFWLFLLSWVALVAAVVYEERYNLGGGYLALFYCAATSLSSLIILLECFALPRKSKVAGGSGSANREVYIIRPGSAHSSALIAPSADERAALRPELAEEEEDDQVAEEIVTETTPLFRGPRRPTFANFPRSQSEYDEDRQRQAAEKEGIYGHEQSWSGPLPQWTWLLQFLVLAPFNVILIGQAALLFTSATYQTGADGSSMLVVHIAIALLTILLLLPLAPFLHRFTYHVPTFLLFVCLGTLLYNLAAFPFSANNRYKAYFIQTVDLDTGVNQVSLSGIPTYVHQIISHIPSAAGQKIQCKPDERGKAGLTQCSWNGLSPKVVRIFPAPTPPSLAYKEWVHFNVSRPSSTHNNGTHANTTTTTTTKKDNTNQATFHLWGRNTRACKLLFNKPISDFYVNGAAGGPSHNDPPTRFFKPVPPAGSSEIRLWRREWERAWTVHVRWPVSEGKRPGEEGLDGKVVCLWSDDNHSGTIPALDELRRYAPVWAGFTKLADGLVEGERRFMV